MAKLLYRYLFLICFAIKLRQEINFLSLFFEGKFKDKDFYFQRKIKSELFKKVSREMKKVVGREKSSNSFK